MLEIIGFITLLYLAIRYFPQIIMLAFQIVLILAIIVLGVMAFEVIYHYIYFRT